MVSCCFSHLGQIRPQVGCLFHSDLWTDEKKIVLAPHQDPIQPRHPSITDAWSKRSRIPEHHIPRDPLLPVSQTLLSELSQRGISREDFCQDTSKAAELVGLASQPAIDVLCRKRAPMKRSGSVANGNLPVGLAAYWNYEPKQSEKIGDAL